MTRSVLRRRMLMQLIAELSLKMVPLWGLGMKQPSMPQSLNNLISVRWGDIGRHKGMSSPDI